jgi:hypothetical protein
LLAVWAVGLHESGSKLRALQTLRDKECQANNRQHDSDYDDDEGESCGSTATRAGKYTNWIKGGRSQINNK